ncbi:MULTISPECIES: carboxymuconolactone decarboxylase family protein [Spongiibacter]|uniref:carboxymuconolactone decarboxylase family protein n=1 Tax=Spongiibacter TaxID=630749 RepID=UPI00257984FC|nr:carboxymuconolactone decarboxylase family protein [Spongiibacter sp.]
MSTRVFSRLLFVLSLITLTLPAQATSPDAESNAMTATHELTSRQQSLLPIAAYAAQGDLKALETALHDGLASGITVNDAKEVLTQLYAYAGFPRSLNALGTLMAVIEDRRSRGIDDEIGRPPQKPIPEGAELLAAGTANQTRLVGNPVKGPLFDFAPAIGEYLKTHLFGDIFSRDNLNWEDRELATIAMLAAIPGAEPQLAAHLNIALNTHLTPEHLHHAGTVLVERVGGDTATRAQQALAQLSTPETRP